MVIREPQPGNAAKPPSLLELLSKLGRPEEGRWVLGLYPGAAEAGGCFVSAGRPGQGAGGLDNAPDRIAEARRKVRRYCAANRLNRLGTLTYQGSGCHDPALVRDHVAEFIRELRATTGGKRFPYLWTDEWHPGGHGLHVHFAVGRFIPRRALERSWHQGFIDIKLIGDLPVGSGALAEARKAAFYLAKYLVKDAEGRAGLHRYEVAQGFQPEKRQLTGRSEEDVTAQAVALMGAKPALIWRSSQAEMWAGPPAVWMSWNR